MYVVYVSVLYIWRGVPTVIYVCAMRKKNSYTRDVSYTSLRFVMVVFKTNICIYSIVQCVLRKVTVYHQLVLNAGFVLYYIYIYIYYTLAASVMEKKRKLVQTDKHEPIAWPWANEKKVHPRFFLSWHLQKRYNMHQQQLARVYVATSGSGCFYFIFFHVTS